MVIGTSEITTSIVANTIGENSHDIGTLCVSNKINIWSKFKPMIALMNGIGLNPTMPYANNFLVKHEFITPDHIYYLVPITLVELAGDGNYRLGDFRNYEHDQNIQGKPEIRFQFNELFSGEHSFTYTKYITRAELLKNIMFYNGGNVDYANDEQPLALTTPTSYILPNDLIINLNNEIELQGAFEMPSEKAYWLFDNISFNGESKIISFVNPSTSNKIFLSKEDALNTSGNITITGGFNRPTTINPHLGGSTRDIPLKPIITIDGVTPPDTDVYTPNYFIITNCRLFALDQTSQGGNIAYTILLAYKFDGTKYGNKRYNVEIRSDLYSINWTTKVINLYEFGGTTNLQYADLGGHPDFERLENIQIDFAMETEYKYIHLTTIPFDEMFSIENIWNERSEYAIKLNIALTQV